MSSSTLEIRPMTPADQSRVAELLAACYHWLSEREGFNAAQLAFLLDRTTERILEEESRTRPHIVACRGAAVLGMAVLNGKNLARLYVDPPYHRQGVGAALFRAAEDMVRAGGHAEMTVAALVESAAAFYRAMGMVEYDRVEYEPQIFVGRKITLLREDVSRTRPRG